MSQEGKLQGAFNGPGSYIINVKVENEQGQSRIDRISHHVSARSAFESPLAGKVYIGTPKLFDGNSYELEPRIVAGTIGRQYEITSIDNLPPSFAFHQGKLTGSIPDAGWGQEYQVVVHYRDNLGNVFSENLSISGAPDTPPIPVLTTPVPQLVVGWSIHHDLGLRDTKGNVFNVTSVDGLPDGVNLDGNYLTGTPAIGSDKKSVLLINGVDGNGKAFSIRQAITVERQDRLPVATLSVSELTEHSAAEINIITTDPDGDSVTIESVTGLPQGLSWSGSQITGTPSYVSAGEHPILVALVDSRGIKNEVTLTLNITNVNRGPISSVLPALSTTSATVFNFSQLKSAFSDPDGDTLTYSATLLVADQEGVLQPNPLPTGVHFDGQTAVLSGQLPFAGEYQFRITGSDGNQSISSDVTLTVTADPLARGYRLSDGDVTIGASESVNALYLGAGINSGDVQIRRQDQDLLLQFASGQTVRIVNGFNLGSPRLNSLHFANGQQLSSAQILREANRIEGSQSAETLTGTSQGETIIANGGTDRITGGKGDDIIDGGLGDDYYVYNLGDGNDVIIDAGGYNRLVFGPGINRDNINIKADLQGNMRIVMPDGSAITVNDWLHNNRSRIGSLRFHNGFELNRFYFEDYLRVKGTSGDDSSDFSHVTEVDLGHLMGKGDDQIRGGGRDDLYIYNKGDGKDTIYDNGGYNRLAFGAGITQADFRIELSADNDGDMVIHLSDGGRIRVKNWQKSGQLTIKAISFANGEVWDKWGISRQAMIIGDDSDNVIDYSTATTDQQIAGGKGNDQITGGGFADVYYYNLGDGNDEITDTAGNNRLILGTGISPETLGVSLNNSGDLQLSVQDGGVITYKNWLSSGNTNVKTLEFADGTVWNTAKITQLAQATTTVAEQLSLRVPQVHHRGTVADDQIKGGTGSDVYHYNLGDGNDVIDTNTGGHDILVLGPGIEPGNIQLQLGLDGALKLTMPDGQVLTIKNWHDVGRTKATLETIVFNNGQRWSPDQVGRLLPVSGTDGADNLNFEQFGHSLAINSGKGDDTITGSRHRGDYYQYQLGDGNDTIIDASPINFLSFGEGILPAEVTMSAQAGGDLQIQFKDGGTLTVKDWLHQGQPRINRMFFANGVTWNIYDIGQRVATVHTQGDDNIDLSHSKTVNRLIGGKGNDVIHGGTIGDFYLYTRGDGQDVFRDGGGHDRLVLQEIDPSEVTLNLRPNGDLLVELPNNGSITFKEGVKNGQVQLEEVRFSNGIVWDRNRITSLLQNLGTDGNDSWDYSQFLTNQTHRGGKGDDTITGGKYHDTFYYDLGDGNDVIDDLSTTNSPQDRLIFGAGITPDNISMEADPGGDMRIHLPDGAVITIKNWYENNYGKLNQIAFSDGTSWDLYAIGTRVVTTGTTGNDTLNASAANTSVSHRGGKGDDRITGGRFSDTFYYDLGDGNDIIDDISQGNSPQERLIFGAGITPDNIRMDADPGGDMRIHLPDGAVITIKDWYTDNYSKLNQMVFKDGTQWDLYAISTRVVTTGTAGNDTLDATAAKTSLSHRGGKGDDTITGSRFSDTFYYDLGDGNDVIDDISVDNGPQDRLIFGEGITPGNIRMDADPGGDMRIHLPDGAVITVKDWYANNVSKLNQMVFKDGTLWDLYAISTRVVTTGTTGNDTLDATAAKTSVSHRGGKGDDIITGSRFSDTFYYDLGDGNDVIDDISADNGPQERLIFGEGITADNIRMEADPGGDMRIHLPDGAVITIKNWYDNNYSKLNQIQFKDGTSWDLYAISAKVVTIGTDGNDSWDASAAKTSLSHQGGKGDDRITGGRFGDRFYYNLGDGNDVIDDTSTENYIHDSLIFGAGITPDNIRMEAEPGGDMRIHLPDGAVLMVKNWFEGNYSKINLMTFANGVTLDVNAIGQRVITTGSTGNDNWDVSASTTHRSHKGGKGDDTITGGKNYDIFYYDLGDGNDVIDDASTANYIQDRIVFGAGITPDNIRMEADPGGDMRIHLPDGGVLTVKNWFAGNYSKINQMKFADGTNWDVNGIGHRVVTTGGSGNDSWDMSQSVHHLSHKGGKGDDTITGGKNYDNFYYNLGDGNDVIDDASTANYIQDRIIFGAGITKDNIRMEADPGGDLRIHLPDGGVLTVKDWYAGNYSKINQMSFSDGTSLDVFGIGSRVAITGTDGNDSWDHSAATTSLGHKGGKGDDEIVGGGSHDKYYFSPGDGHDTITDSRGTDYLYLQGVHSNHVRVTRETDDLRIRLNGTDDTITVKNWFASASNKIESITFANAVFGVAQLEAKIGQGNTPPTGEAMTALTVTDITPVNYQAADFFSDIDGDKLRFTAVMLVTDAQGATSEQPLPAGLILNTETGQFSGTVSALGAHRIKVTASDRSASVSQIMTLTIEPSNTAPVYTGVTEQDVISGQFIRLAVPFSDDSSDTLRVTVAGLPEWLSHDGTTGEIYGFVPTGVQDSLVLQVTGTDSQQASTTARVNLTFKTPAPIVVQNVQLQNQQLRYDDAPLSYNVSQAFSSLSGTVSYVFEQQQADGSWKTLPSDHWLSLSNGLITGQPQLSVVTGGENYRVVASNTEGEKAMGQFNLKVEGPAKRTVGKLEQVSGHHFSVEARDYFSGLSQNAKYGVIVSLDDGGNNNSPVASAASVASPQARSLSLSSASAQASVSAQSLASESASSVPEVVIPDALKSWLSFDAQTGRLSGTPPEAFIAGLKLTFLAQDGGVNLSTDGDMNIGKGATEETYWFTYDKANRVAIDGGTQNAQGNIVLGDQGQYLQYDAAGRVNFIINGQGHTAQKLSYSEQGYLTHVQQTFGLDPSNRFNKTIDLFAQRQQQSWNGIGWSKSVSHQYTLLGQRQETVYYFTPGTLKTVEGITYKEFTGSYSVTFDLTGQEKIRQTFGYNKDGQTSGSTRQGWASWQRC